MQAFRQFIAFTLLATVALFAQAQTDEAFLEGGHYELLDENQPVSTGDKVEVLELFWYGCPHCYSLEGPLKAWLKNGIPANAQYVAFPAPLNDNWTPGAHAFYTFEALGKLDEYHEKFFSALHSERKRINTAAQLAEWVESIGGDKQAILDTYDSFAVTTKVSYAKTMSKRYGISGVPAVVVDGRYRTSVSMAGGPTELFQVIEFLIEKAAAERVK